MESHPLLLGLTSRLNGHDVKLRDKLTLIRNIYKSNVLIPFKDEHIFKWILSTLDEKYSDSNVKQKDIDNVWEVLSLCLEKIDENEAKIGFDNDALCTLLDRADVSNDNTSKSLSHILNILSKWKEYDNIASNLCLKLAQKDSLPENLTTLLLNHFSRCDSINKGVFLANVSKSITPLNLDLFTAICRIHMLKNSEDLQHLFTHIRQAGDKYEGPEQVHTLLNYIENDGDLLYILKSASDPSISTELRTLLMILSVNLTGQKLFTEESLMMAKMLVSVKKIPSLLDIVNTCLPVDLDFVHTIHQRYVEDSTITVFEIMSNVLSTILNEGLTKESILLISNFSVSYPTVIQAQMSLILSKCLAKKDETSLAILKLLVDVLLKMKKLPSLVTRFMYYSENSSLYVSWDQEHLNIFGDALGKITRAQCLDIWLAMHNILTVGFRDQEKENYWCFAAPILKVLFTHCMLIDHNVPEGIYLKIKKFVSSTFEEIICGFQNRKFQPDDQVIYENLVSSFLEFICVFSAYQNCDFSVIKEFETNLLKKILKNGKLGGYFTLVVNAVETNTELGKELLETFESDLSGFVKIKITEPMETETEISVESIGSILQSLYAELAEQNKRLEKLTNKKLWKNSESSSSEDKLNKLLINEAAFLSESSLKIESSKLSSLPIEDLPSSFKFATTILAFYSFFNEESDESFVLVARCLESFNIFDNLHCSKLLNRILSLQTELPEYFLKRLSLVLYQLKTIPDIKENFKIFDENIQNKVPNYFHFFTEFLEKISETSSAVVEPQEIYAVISALLIKCVIKSAKQSISDEDLPYHFKVVHALFSFYPVLDSKQEKYVKKVCAACSQSPLLVDLVWHLMSDEGKNFVDKEMMLGAWKIAIDSETTANSIDAGVKVLDSLDTEDFSNLINMKGRDLSLARILIAVKTESANKLHEIKVKLHDLLLKIIKNDSIVAETKEILLLSCIEKRKCPVEKECFVLALSLLVASDGLTPYCSPVTAKIIDIFIMSKSQDCVSFIVEAIRSHILHLAQETDNLEITRKNQEISYILNSIFLRISRSHDYKPAAPYLLSDIVTSLLTITNPDLKNQMLQNFTVLRSCCEHSPDEYLAANLPTFSTEMLKSILADIKK